MDTPQDGCPSVPWVPYSAHDSLFTTPISTFPGDFPTDLLSHIFKNLIPSDENGYNCSDLQNCSLTCRLWRDYAQLMLLRHPVIRNPGSFLALYQVIRQHHSRWHRHSIPKGISLLLKAPSCGKSRTSLQWRRSRNWHSLCKVLSFPCIQYTNLQLDHFDRICWEHLSLSIQMHNISLHHLRLTFCHFTTVEEFDNLIKSFKSISKLTLDYVRFKSTGFLPFRFSKHPSQNLRNLRIGPQSNVYVLVPWVLGTQSWEQIETLEIDEISSRPGDRICEAIEVVRLLDHVRCKGLPHLKLGCQFDASLYHNNSLPIGLSGVDLRIHNQHLRLLDLQSDSLCWIVDFLATGTFPWRPLTPGLMSILFDIWVLTEHQLRGTVLDGIAQMIAHLMTMKFSRLQIIKFIQRGPLSMDRVELTIRSTFSRWGLGGDVLRFSRGSVD